jgi:hypothetical protein
MGTTTEQERKIILALWYLRCLRSGDVHYATAMKRKWYDRLLTLANVTSSIFVLWASQGISSLEKMICGSDTACYSLPDRILSAILLIATFLVVLSSVLQYVLNGSELSARHHEAGIKYSTLKREIEVMMTKGCTDADVVGVEKRLSEAADTSELAPHGIWKKSNKLENDIQRIQTWLIKTNSSNLLAPAASSEPPPAKTGTG